MTRRWVAFRLAQEAVVIGAAAREVQEAEAVLEAVVVGFVVGGRGHTSEEAAQR